MMDLMMVPTFTVFALLGATTRALFGIYRAYTRSRVFGVDKRRIGVEILASTFFGLFFSIILLETKWVNFSMIIVALISGFFGASLVKLVTKKVGLKKGINVRVDGKSIAYADLNDRQIKAIEFLEGSNGKLTNDIYQRLNPGISHSSAKRDLGEMVKRGKIKRHGRGRGTYYTL